MSILCEFFLYYFVLNLQYFSFGISDASKTLFVPYRSNSFIEAFLIFGTSE